MDLASFKTLVQNELENSETSFVANLNNFIKMAEREIYISMGNTFITRFTYDCITAPNVKLLTVGQNYFDVPDALDIESVYVAGSNDPLLPLGWRQLQLRDSQFLDTAYADKITTTSFDGRPRYYAIRENNLTDDNSTVMRVLVAPTPNVGYMVRYTFHKYPTSLTVAPADTEGTYLSINYTNVLLYGTVCHAYIYLKGNPEVMAMYKDRYDTGLAHATGLFKAAQRNDAARDGQV